MERQVEVNSDRRNQKSAPANRLHAKRTFTPALVKAMINTFWNTPLELPNAGSVLEMTMLMTNTVHMPNRMIRIQVALIARGIDFLGSIVSAWSIISIVQ
jgi:hypothetical protein